MANLDQTYLGLLSRLFANWPIEEKRVPVLTKELRAIFNEVGEHRFAAGVDAIIRSNPYQKFPTAAELRGYIPKAAKRPLCGECQDGWKYVPDYEARRLYKNDTAMAVTRCECRRGPGYQKWEETPEWRQ